MRQHEAWCPRKDKDHSDAAKRTSDTYNLHRIGDPYGSIHKWIAVSLSEGRSDDVLYGSKYDAVRHQHHNEKYYTFIKIVPTTMNPCEAEVVLKTARMLYDKGMRMADPDHRHGGPDLIKRLNVSDQLALARGAVQNIRFPGKGE